MSLKTLIQQTLTVCFSFVGQWGWEWKWLFTEGWLWGHFWGRLGRTSWQTLWMDSEVISGGFGSITLSVTQSSWMSLCGWSNDVLVESIVMMECLHCVHNHVLQQKPGNSCEWNNIADTPGALNVSIKNRTKKTASLWWNKSKIRMQKASVN